VASIQRRRDDGWGEVGDGMVPPTVPGTAASRPVSQRFLCWRGSAELGVALVGSGAGAPTGGLVGGAMTAVGIAPVVVVGQAEALLPLQHLAGFAAAILPVVPDAGRVGTQQPAPHLPFEQRPVLQPS
jgi:hypothetical protein